MIFSLETDVERLKADLRSSRAIESDLRSQLSQINNGEKSAAREVIQLRLKAEQLDTK
jgi:hypothetical protein